MSKYDTEDEVNHITELWGKGAGGIEPGEEGKGRYTQKEQVYFRLFEKMLNFKGGQVIEIGPGTGDFALTLMKYFPIKEYTILDLKKNIKDSMNLFNKNNLTGNFIESKNYKQTFNKSYDLFVSNMCLSEVPSYYRKDILEHVLPNCQSVFIVDCDCDQDSYNQALIMSVVHNFRLIQVEKTLYQCFAISGKK